MTRLLCLAFLLLMSFSASSADLAIGTSNFRLGQSEADAMKMIEGNFKIISLQSPDDLVLADPKTSKLMGTISFKKGQVTFIGRSWGNFYGDSSSIDAAQALISALESATTQSGHAARIEHKTTHQPGTEYRVTEFIFSGRKVSLMLVKSESDGEQVAVNESIFP